MAPTFVKCFPRWFVSYHWIKKYSRQGSIIHILQTDTVTHTEANLSKGTQPWNSGVQIQTNDCPVPFHYAIISYTIHNTLQHFNTGGLRKESEQFKSKAIPSHSEKILSSEALTSRWSHHAEALHDAHWSTTRTVIRTYVHTSKDVPTQADNPTPLNFCIYCVVLFLKICLSVTKHLLWHNILVINMICTFFHK